MLLVLAVSLFWALMIQLCNNLGISPGWGMTAVFTIAIFTFSIMTEKVKYEMNQDLEELKSKRGDS